MRQRLTLNLATIGITLALTACGESTSSETGAQYGNPSTAPVDNNFNESALIVSVVDNVLIPTYQSFAIKADSLHQSVDTYCKTLRSSTDTQTAQVEVQESWKEAMNQWQLAEVMQIGPLAENDFALRNRIYSWPNVSTCAIDQEVVKSQADNYDISTRTASRRGLYALEYTLFNPDFNHTCTVAGTEPDNWDKLSDQQRRQARCDYAEIVASDLVNNANTLVTEWTGEAGYGDVLKAAGEPDSRFTTSLAAVNDISDAMFYVKEVTKDAKIATPVGIFANDCGTSPCPENAESAYANYSLENIIANLKALKTLFLGGEESHTGFDDFLTDVGDTDTATRLRADIDAAIEYAESINGSFASTLQNNPEQIENLHDDVKKVTDTMKTDFIESLALELPATSAGDND
ncbi:imelysin family protein [Alteromonas sp. ASW11-130]|uniref:imelysin family protein n=1 Tax=Alteromonas sp. ASW11-130 TaxID=3015775 RepID=UPI0022426867|nr:imelysin family protein [Alteromonas sp. ASW11-130]MCW8092975.1 imelysin family protein [Alteromonas sp. ASW11-130]